MGSKLELVELGLDDDGDQMNSCIIVPTAVVDNKARTLPDGAKLALDQLQELIADIGEIPPASNHIPSNTKVCSTEIWREHFYNTHPGKPDTKQKAFVRASMTLQKARLIGVWNYKAWLAGHAGHTQTFKDVSGERIEPDKATGRACSKKARPDRQDTPPLGVSGVRQPCPDRLSEQMSVQSPGLKSDDLPYDDPVVDVPEQGPDDLDEHGALKSGGLRKPWKPFPFHGPPDRPREGTPCAHCGKVEGEIILLTEPHTVHGHHPLHKECAAEFFAKLKEAASAASGKKGRGVGRDTANGQPTATNAGASVKFMLTAWEKLALRSLGYTDEQIRQMTPAEGQAILARKRAEKNPEPQFGDSNPLQFGNPDLDYHGPVVDVPDLGPDDLDEHGASKKE
jgi:hypothetical protein